ncbi:hypothetical protein BCR39DRAFT_533731, partial [Naematelia encephala]
MSINHPKQKQIRLPFSVPRPSSSTATVRICGICRKRDSRYTCPRCNVAYCSLECFRDQKHAQCSEPFYRTTVMEAISTDEQAGLEEKKAMLEMLRRFEEGAAGDEEALRELEEDEEEEDEQLRTLLAEIDLDDIDSNQLFHLLPPKHRDKFIAAIKNPESEETKELLEDAVRDGRGETGLPIVLPWWERPVGIEGEEEEEDDDVEDEDELKGYTDAPELLNDEVLASIKPPDGTGAKLVYNAISICIAYLHALLSLRLPSLSCTYLDDQAVTPREAKEEILRLVPFLADAKSTVRYESTREAYSSVWETIGHDIDPPLPPTTLLRLLDTLAPLLHPPLLTSVPPNIIVVLSDLYHLYSLPKAGAAVPRKLAFYIAALRSLKREDWLRLEREVQKESTKLRNEIDEVLDENVEEDRPALRIA